MNEITVTVDTEAAERMLQRFANRPAFTSAVMDAAQQGASMISGIPQDTGELASSIRATPGRSPSPNSALIVSDVSYARFVFGGVPSRGQAAQHPNVPYGAIAHILAANVVRELER